MNKDQVKTICEADETLKWWAMLLFAEISDFTNIVHQSQFDSACVAVLYRKVKEFESIVIHSKFQESKKLPSLEQRVRLIEEKLGIQSK